MFIRYSELLVGQLGRARMNANDHQLTYSIHKRTRPSENGPKHTISLRMNEVIMKMAKFHVGDKLEFLFDLEHDAGRIEKAQYGGGHSLSKSGEHGAIIRMPYIPSSGLPMVTHPIPMEKVEIIDGGIQFRFPAHLSRGRGMAAASEQDRDKVPGPPNPPKPANDNPVG